MNKETQQTFPYDKLKRIWWRCPVCYEQEVEVIQLGYHD